MRILALLLLFMLAPSVYADTALHPYPLNTVNLQLAAEQWVSTQTANVIVNIDANLNQAGLADAHKQIMANLAKIAKDVDWHITLFKRSKDQSGLETLHVEAQARLPESALAGLRDKAQAVTQPATRYSIANIDFTPSFAELEQVKAQMRAQIYAAAKTELVALNKDYPEQHYFLHTINFMVNELPPIPMAKNLVMTAVSSNEANAFATSNKLTLVANLVFASTANVQAVINK